MLPTLTIPQGQVCVCVCVCVCVWLQIVILSFQNMSAYEGIALFPAGISAPSFKTHVHYIQLWH